MKLIVTTVGNPEAGDPKTFTNIYICDYFTIERQEGNGDWLTLFGGPQIPEGQKELMIGIDLDIETITVVE